MNIEELIHYLETMLNTSIEMCEIARQELLKNPTEDNFINLFYWHEKVEVYRTKIENYLELIGELESQLRLTFLLGGSIWAPAPAIFSFLLKVA